MHQKTHGAATRAEERRGGREDGACAIDRRASPKEGASAGPRVAEREGQGPTARLPVDRHAPCTPSPASASHVARAALHQQGLRRPARQVQVQGALAHSMTSCTACADHSPRRLCPPLALPALTLALARPDTCHSLQPSEASTRSSTSSSPPMLPPAPKSPSSPTSPASPISPTSIL